MSQIQVKQIIHNFCKILESFNFSKITPEDMRLAKYNKPNVVKKMWKLLFELISYLKNKNKNKIDNQFVSDQFNELNQDKLVEYVKEQMLRLGYISEEFFKLSSSFDEPTSRELIIAIGWLISTYEIIDHFIENSSCLMDEEYYKEGALKSINITEIKKETDNLKSQFNSSKNNDLFAQLNHIKLLDGIFKNKFNTLHSCLCEKAKLTYKAHSNNNGTISCLELYLLKNPDKIEKYEKHLEKKIEFQNNVLEWIKNEDLFWKWMESVVDEKITENDNLVEEPIESFEKLLVQVLKENMKNAKVADDNFEKKMEKLRDLELEIKSKLSGENFEGLDQEKLSSLKSFENEVSETLQKILFNEFVDDPALEKQDFLKFDMYEPRLQFVGKNSKLSSQSKQGTSTLKEENERIEKLNKHLEQIFINYKNDAFQKCEKISSKLNECHVLYNQELDS